MLVLGRKPGQEIVINELSVDYQIVVKVYSIHMDQIKIKITLDDYDVIANLYDNESMTIYSPSGEKIIIKLVEMCDSYVKIGFICEKVVKVVRQELLKSSA